MPTRNLPPALARLIKIVTWSENALLIGMLALMVGLAAAQILFRNLFDMSIFGADQMLRLLVLWVAFLGAVAASREGKHIHVDAIARWLPARVKPGVVALTDLFTLAVCLSLAWQALRFIQSARISGEMAFGSMPVWIAALILPLGFTLIALRYGLRFMHHVQQARGREGGWMTILVGIALIAMMLLGAPLFAVIAASVMVNFAREDVDLTVVVIEIYRLAEMPVLLAIPLFTFAGYLLAESHAPQRLVRITNVFFGWMPGGLAAVALVICAMFTAFTGASGVTIVALGGMLYPALKQAGYPERYSLGLVTTSGSIGLLFAPSLPLILYGVVAQQLNIGHPVSISDLFLAGILPGLLIVVLLSVYGLLQKRGPGAAHQPFSVREALAAVREAGWELPLPFIVLGGIYSGYFAVSEAAAVTAIYVFIVEVIIHREITFTNLPRIMRESMVLVGAILIVLGMSLASTNYLLDAEIPAKLFSFIRTHVDNAFTFLLLLNVFLLMLGMMLDIFSALVIMVPLILPIAVGYGIHPVHLGIIFLANMEIAYLMPPMGMNLFIAMYRFDRPMLEIFRSVLPFVAILLLAVLVITYWPALSLALLKN